MAGDIGRGTAMAPGSQGEGDHRAVGGGEVGGLAEFPLGLGELGFGAGDLGLDVGDLVLFAFGGLGAQGSAGLGFGGHHGGELTFKVLDAGLGLFEVEPIARAGLGQFLELLQTQPGEFQFGIDGLRFWPVAPLSCSSRLRELASALRSCTRSRAICDS
jgi:hypothetical protein